MSGICQLWHDYKVVPGHQHGPLPQQVNHQHLGQVGGLEVHSN